MKHFYLKVSLAVCFLSISSHAYAATYYVSQSTANGYAVGNDSNTALQAQSTSTPWLSIAKAVSTAPSGSTIQINNGTYVESSAGAGYLSLTLGQSLVPATPYAVTIQASSSGATRVVSICTSDSNPVTIGSIIIDSKNLNANGVTISACNPSAISLAFNGTQFSNFTTFAVNPSTQHLNLTCNNCTLNATGLNAVPSGGIGYTVADGTLTISSSTINITGNNSAGHVHGIYAVASTTSATENISSSTINVTTNGAVTTAYGIYTQGFRTLSLGGNTISVNATSTSANSRFYYGIQVTNPASQGYSVSGTSIATNTITMNSLATTTTVVGINLTDTATSTINANVINLTGVSSADGIEVFSGNDSVNAACTTVSNNYVNHLVTSGLGHGIEIGSDGSVGINSDFYTNNPIVFGNTVSGTGLTIGLVHGIMLGSLSGGKVYGNRLNNMGIGLLAKLTTGPGPYYYGNEVATPANASNTAQSLRAKGANGAMFYNNSIYQTLGRSGTAMWADQDPTSGINSSNIVYANNNIYADGIINSNGFVYVAPASSATFANNNYYYTGTLIGNQWIYQSSSYSTLASWQSAQESTAIAVNPLFNNLFGDWTLQSSSTLIDMGTTSPIFGALDFASLPFYGNPDIGAHEYQPMLIMGTDKVNPSGNIRIYGDGTYRYTTATTTTTLATFTAAPTGGSWTYGATATRPEWLNVSNMIWHASGDYTKSWTASSTFATTTTFNIGDLQPSTSYSISVDGTPTNTITSNGLGVITYAYNLGATSHSFSVNPFYTLTYSAGSNGTLTGSSTQVVNSGANGSAVTAVPNSGYHFVSWSDASTSNPRTDANVVTNITVTANFSLNGSPVNPPGVSAVSVSSISTTGAVLSASITADNGASSTVEGFNYGTAASYGSVASVSGTFGVGPITSQTLTVLSCGTTYHVQAFATNSGGTVGSSDATFTTLACPAVVSNSPSSSGGGSISSSQLATILAPSAATTAYLNSLKQTQNQNTTTPVPQSVATVAPVSYGSDGSAVLGLQKILVSQGLMPSTTGFFGPSTKKAVIAFQLQHHIISSATNPSAGIVGPKTIAAIQALASAPSASVTVTPASATNTSFTTSLSEGDTGPEVKALEIYLNSNGYTIAQSGPGSPGNETNRFGPSTKAALMKFQKAHGIPATGFFGPVTRGLVGR